ncbi:YicC/YloC family endoribonuclease [Oscillatoria amoena NRMC-F 0135]|nr:YicC/YloC family endoribonuclease [Oscillatoria amoena NRMC-F 0135]
MIKSMTGYGNVSHDDGRVQVQAEVKSLNSKFLDLNIRIPKSFSDKELEIRSLISEKLERGKVSISVEFQRMGEAEIRQTYNEALFIQYYTQLKKLADRAMASYENLFSLALSSPDVIQSKLTDGASEEDWQIVRKAIADALAGCEAFRLAEGKVLERVLMQYCESIRISLKHVESLDPKRIEKIRERLKGNIESLFGEGYDVNRLEQEIIYYAEKFDIHEERVRLKAHLDHFQQALTESQSNGKKLGFIAQEIGREINTIGSKANDAGIQKHVVAMKEELEKIKEQLNNVV